MILQYSYPYCRNNSLRGIIVLYICKQIRVTSKLTSRKLSDHENKRYNCSKCDNTYADKATMQRHFSAVHEKNPKVKIKVKCTFCEKLYSSRERLGRHVRGHHLGMSCCQICKKNLSCSLSLKNHMESFHAQDVIQCGMCDFRTKSKVHATKHRKPVCFSKKKVFHCMCMLLRTYSIHQMM